MLEDGSKISIVSWDHCFCELFSSKIIKSPDQSTQVRQRPMKCNIQLLHGASGPAEVKNNSGKSMSYGNAHVRRRSMYTRVEINRQQEEQLTD